MSRKEERLACLKMLQLLPGRRRRVVHSWFDADPASWVHGSVWPVPFVIKKFAWSENIPPGAGNACLFLFLFRLIHLSGLLSISCKEIEWETSVNGASVLTSSQLSSEV